jgi:hypothetical protein
MQNSPNGPYDDVFNNLAKIVEDIVKNMPENQNARIIGYTIITRQPSSEDPRIYQFDPQEDDNEIPYEVMESEDQIFITATLPADPKNAPYAEIETDLVRIVVDDRTVTVMLDHTVDRIHSYYRIHRGVMDITLRKARMAVRPPGAP